MKLILATLLLVAVTTAENLYCDDKFVPDEAQSKWIDLPGKCMNEVKRQIQKEVTASMAYLAMGAHFGKDSINRPGFSEFFFKAAGEEREHATKLIEYLLMRGELVGGISDLIKVEVPAKIKWTSGVEALKDALNTEADVTKSIRQVIIQCEDDHDRTDKSLPFNDYHLVDYLTGVFLEEQYHGQRDLAGKLSTLGKLMTSHGELGEFLFDKKLLD